MAVHFQVFRKTGIPEAQSSIHALLQTVQTAPETEYALSSVAQFILLDQSPDPEGATVRASRPIMRYSVPFLLARPSGSPSAKYAHALFADLRIHPNKPQAGGIISRSRTSGNVLLPVRGRFDVLGTPSWRRRFDRCAYRARRKSAPPPSHTASLHGSLEEPPPRVVFRKT